MQKKRLVEPATPTDMEGAPPEMPPPETMPPEGAPPEMPGQTEGSPEEEGTETQDVEASEPPDEMNAAPGSEDLHQKLDALLQLVSQQGQQIQSLHQILLPEDAEGPQLSPREQAKQGLVDELGEGAMGHLDNYLTEHGNDTAYGMIDGISNHLGTHVHPHIKNLHERLAALEGGKGDLASKSIGDLAGMNKKGPGPKVISAKKEEVNIMPGNSGGAAAAEGLGDSGNIIDKATKDWTKGRISQKEYDAILSKYSK